MCHLRSETSASSSCCDCPPSSSGSAHTIRATFPSLFPPFFPPRLLLCCVAEPEPQARGGKHGFIFTAFHSRKAECLVNWYAPFYPLHRPDNVSQRRNLTSSRLDPTERRSYSAHWQATVFSLTMSNNKRKLIKLSGHVVIILCAVHD